MGDLAHTADALKSTFDQYINSDLPQAKAVVEQLQELAETTGNGYIHGLSLLAQGDLRRADIDYHGALLLYEEAAKVFKESREQAGWARAWGARFLVAAFLGEVTADILQECDSARDALATTGDAFRCAMLDQNIGLALHMMGHFAEALTSFQRGLAWAEKITDGRASGVRSMLHSNIAKNALLRGDLDAVLATHYAAHKVFQASQAWVAVAKEELHISLAERLRGNYPQALKMAQHATILFQEAGVAHSGAIGLIYQADILLVLNRADEAEVVARNAVAIMRPLVTPSDAADVLRVLARCLRQNHHYREAIATLDEARSMLPMPRLPIEAIAVEMEQAATLAEADERTAATLLAESAIAHATEYALPLLLQQATLLRAEIAFRYGADDEARHLLLPMLEAAGDAEIRLRTLVVLAHIAKQKQHFEQAQDYFDQAIEELHESLHHLVYDQRSAFLISRDAVIHEAIALAIRRDQGAKALSLLEKTRTAVAGANPLQAEGAIHPEIEALLQKHRRQSAFVASLQEATAQTLLASRSEVLQAATVALQQANRDLRDAIERLPKEELASFALAPDRLTPDRLLAGNAIVAYVYDEQQLFALILTSQHIRAQVLPIAVSQCVKLVQGVQQNMRTVAHLVVQGDSAQAVMWEAHAQALLRALWDALLAPLMDDLAGVSGRLTFVPYGVLHALPFAALFDGQRYAVERWTLHLAHSGVLALTPMSPPIGPQRQPLTIGHDWKGHLPGALHEARTIANLSTGEAWLAEAATSSRLRAEIGNRRFVHLAMHGAVRLDLPDSSYLWLEDGPFHPFDVLSLDLHGCQLVTLSACETGLSRSSGGDSQVGLVRAFNDAGAQATLSTLWRVADAETLVFMQQFYQTWLSNQPLEAAVQQSQLHFLHETAVNFRHPYFWAGFQLFMQGGQCG